MNPKFLLIFFSLIFFAGCFESGPQQTVKSEEVDKVLYDFTAKRLMWNLYEDRQEQPVPDNQTLLMQIATSSGYQWASFKSALKKYDKKLHDQIVAR